MGAYERHPSAAAHLSRIQAVRVENHGKSRAGLEDMPPDPPLNFDLT